MLEVALERATQPLPDETPMQEAVVAAKPDTAEGEDPILKH